MGIAFPLGLNDGDTMPGRAKPPPMQLLGAKPAPEPCMHWHHDKAPVHISVMSKHHQRLKSGEKKAPRAPSLSRQYPAPPHTPPQACPHPSNRHESCIDPNSPITRRCGNRRAACVPACAFLRHARAHAFRSGESAGATRIATSSRAGGHHASPIESSARGA